MSKFEQAGPQPYVTAVYDKVDAIRFEVFMQSFTAIMQAMIACGDFTTLPGTQMNKESSPLILANHAEDLMQAALYKMEGLEILQRRGLPEEVEPTDLCVCGHAVRDHGVIGCAICSGCRQTYRITKV